MLYSASIENESPVTGLSMDLLKGEASSQLNWLPSNIGLSGMPEQKYYQCIVCFSASPLDMSKK